MISRTAVSLGWLALLCACSKEEESKVNYSIKAELMHQGSGSALQAVKHQRVLTKAVGDQDLWTSDIDISSLKIPITSISLAQQVSPELSATTGNFPVYECSNECDIDLMGPALTNLLKDNVVTFGPETANQEFDVISISPSSGSGNWTGYIKASFSMGGATYYTKGSGSIETTGPAEEMAFTYGGGTMISYLPQKLIANPDADDKDGVSPTTEADLLMRLYFDPLSIAFAIDTSKSVLGVVLSSAQGGNCVGNEGGVKICIQRMQVTGALGDKAPIRERYLINDASLVSALFDESGEGLGGSMMMHFIDGQPFKGYKGGEVDPTTGSGNIPWASGSLVSLEKGADGTYALGNIIKASGGKGGGFLVSDFKRESHEGTYKNDQGTSYSYNAIKIEE